MRPDDRAADGHRTERDAAREEDVPRPVGGHGARQGGDAHDDQGPGGGLRRGLSEREEHGDGEDGPAAAERSQAEPDERAGDDGGQAREGHASGPTRWSPTFSALSKVSSTATSFMPAAERND